MPPTFYRDGHPVANLEIPMSVSETLTPSTNVSTTVISTVASDIGSAASTAEADVSKVETEVGYLRANWGKVSIAVVAALVLVFLIARCV